MEAWCYLPWLLLLPPPDNDHAGGVGGGEEGLIAVETDIQDRAAVSLELVDNSLSVALHVEKVHTGVLAACNYMERDKVDVKVKTLQRAGYYFLLLL